MRKQERKERRKERVCKRVGGGQARKKNTFSKNRLCSPKMGVLSPTNHWGGWGSGLSLDQV